MSGNQQQDEQQSNASTFAEQQQQQMMFNMMRAFMETQAPAQTKLPTPPQYNGNRNASEIDTWIRLIDKHQTHNGWNETKTYNFASTLLSGRAATIISYYEDSDNDFVTPTTWRELKNILIANFRPSNDQDLARDLLVTVRQTGSIRDYVDRFMDAVIPVKEITEREKCDRFMRGLKDKELIAQIRAMNIADRTLEKLFSDSLAYEFAHHPEITSGALTHSGYKGHNNDIQPMDLDAIMHNNNKHHNRNNYNNNYNNHNNNNNNYNYNNNNKNNNRSRNQKGRQQQPSPPDSTNITCYFCKKAGHATFQCRSRAMEIMRAFDKLDVNTRNKLFKSVGALNCIENVNTSDQIHDCDCSQCNSVAPSSSNKTHGSSYLLSLCDEIVESQKRQGYSIDQVIAMIDLQNTIAHAGTTDIATENQSSPNSSTITLDSQQEVRNAVDSASMMDDSNGAKRPVELIPVVHDYQEVFSDETLLSNTASVTKDSVYLTNLLNATNTSTLPLYTATINLKDSSDVISVQCLIDNGASENYISGRIAKIIDGQRNIIYGREVETAGGNISPINEKIVYNLNLQGHNSSMTAFVFDTKFDIILGRSWLKEHKPVADWFDDTWTLSCCGSQKVIISPSSSACVRHNQNKTNRQKPEINYLVSHLQIDKILAEEGTEACFLYLVDESKKDGAELGINDDNTEWMKRLMADFPTVFQEKLPGLPPNRQNFAHVINIPEGTKPINRPPFRMSPAELDELKRQLNELSSLGLIRPSSSPWGAPVLFVKKKNGEMRMCIDYRALNKVTIRNATPLPRIDECLDRLQGASWFTCLDLRSGYHQIRLQDSDIPLTGFNTRYGKWEWLVLPFGLSNAPPSYQTWMNGVLKDCIDKYALVYLDDCCIFSKTLEDHIKHVRQVLSIFEKEGLIVNIKKCEFGKRELDFLGYHVSAKGISPSASKVKAIQAWPRPTNVQEVRQFIGLAQHFRRFCPSFSSIAAPLTELTHGNGAKKRAIVWNNQCEASFSAIKRILTSSPVLKLPDMRKPYRIETDSSDFGVGAVLLQQDEITSSWLPVAYESKKLSKAEQKLPAQERELIAIMHALRTWRCFIDGCQGGYTVYSDHKPLVYFQSQVNPTPRLVRWIADYELFSPNIEYKAGKDNQVADALSRKPDLLLDDGVDVPSLTPEYLYAAWETLPDSIKSDWPLLYIDNEYQRMKPNGKLRKHLDREEDHFVVRQRTVYRKVKTEKGNVSELKFIPFALRADLVFKYHEAFGHAGMKTMLKMFSERYWWPGYRNDIQNWLKTCAACQLNSRRDHAHQDVMHPLQIPKAFDRWHLDFVGELPTTTNGNKWLLTAVDYLTNWPIARAVPVASMEAVADFIYEEIVMRFGCPSEIITDRGANFTSGLVEAYTKRIGTNHKLTSAFHPRTNSKVERYNGTIKQMLRKYVNGAIHRWDDFVNTALWASRVRVHSTTGFSPFYLVYGREPKLPGDILRPYITKEMLLDKRTVADITSRELELLGQHRAAAEFRLKAMGEADKKRWDAKIKPTSFEIGDLVILTHEGKLGLEPRFKGPYVVTKVFPDFGTYQLETVAGEPLQSLVHVDRLKAAKGEKPLTPWYDPTACRRAVREASRHNIETHTHTNMTSSSNNGTTSAVSPIIARHHQQQHHHHSLVLPATTSWISPLTNNMNQPNDDFIDMPVANNTAKTTVTNNAERPIAITPPAGTFTTASSSSHHHANIGNFIPDPIILDEDLSVHGSSVMDETEDTAEPVFRHVLDGYDYISSSSSDSDTEILEDNPPLVANETDSASLMSRLPPSSLLETSHQATLDETILDEQIMTDQVPLDDIDERVSHPEINETMPTVEALPSINDTDNANPPSADTLSSTNNRPNATSAQQPPSPTIDRNITPTQPLPTSRVPSTDFSFFTPPNFPQFPTTIPNHINTPPQSLRIFAARPKAPSSASSSSATNFTPPPTTNTVASSSCKSNHTNVQGRTYVSKGGDVSTDRELD
ncbi:hypothetical protein, partial, partial [Parasitella parasitica]